MTELGLWVDEADKVNHPEMHGRMWNIRAFGMFGQGYFVSELCFLFLFCTRHC